MDYKKEFINLSLKKKALQFGKFTLNSGRISPYFFNSGLLSTGKDIFKIGLCYAHAIMQSKIEFNSLFGAAYKGIPIVISTSIALNNCHQINIPYFFNRKEEKTHGEKGVLIGKNIKNKKIIVLDDVITSGISINQSCKTIEEQNGIISSVFVLLDRKEKKNTNFYTEKNIKKTYDIRSIITINDLITHISSDRILKKHIPELSKYQNQYGI